MIWIKRAGVVVVLAGLGTGNGCVNSDQLLGSDGSSGASAGSPSTTSSPSSVALLEVGASTACLMAAVTWQGSTGPECQVSVVRSTACDCSGAGLGQSEVLSDPRVLSQLEQQGFCGNAGQSPCSEYCACSVAPAVGDAQTQCRQGEQPTTGASGWCHVALTDSDGYIPATCSVDTSQPQSLIRVTGYGAPQAGDLVVLQCSNVAPAPAALGEPCVASDEAVPTFAGYSEKEVNVENNAPQCETELCVVNHFRGRASCPYGQAAGAGQCFVPGGSVVVTAAVAPQLESRRANVASICSCHCDGDGPGPYCTCPDSMQCEHLIDDLHLGMDDLTGSYCIPKGSQYDEHAPNVDCVEPDCGPAEPY